VLPNQTVEGVTARVVEGATPAALRVSIESAWNDRHIPIVVDPSCQQIFAAFEVHMARTQHNHSISVVIDATINKENRAGTRADMAPLVIALGPGFTIPRDCHVIIETNRGHDLGRVLRSGSAAPNTGIPGVLGGESIRRVLRAPCAGILHPMRKIGDAVEANSVVATVDETPVLTQIAGVLRGMAHKGLVVTEGLKIGDVDPRPAEDVAWDRISDKSRTISGGVLEAVMAFLSGMFRIPPPP